MSCICYRINYPNGSFYCAKEISKEYSCPECGGILYNLIGILKIAHYTKKLKERNRLWKK